jgi:hypothetical protein
MKCNFIVVAFLLLLFKFGFAQYAEKTWFNKTDSVYGFYVSIPPVSNRIQGALLLLDGYAGNADRFLSETKIHNVASANDILTICVPTGQRLYIDTAITNLLNSIIRSTKVRYHLRQDQFAIGGRSHGGTIALRYTELTRQNPADFPAQIKACFTVDSPLDLLGLYRSSETELKKEKKGWWVMESEWLIDQMKKDLGDPNIDVKKFQMVSPFIREAKDSTNESLLKNVPVRTFYDVDINWYLENRNRGLYDTDIPAGSELISRLKAMGNTEAEFIPAKQPGRGSDGIRTPHSWNIVD